MMIETIVLDYLTARDLSAYMEMPDDPPASYVLIEKTGGGEEEGLQQATIAIQSYAATLYGAAELNETVKTAMSGLAALDEVCRCRLNSDYNYTDTLTKHYRYQAVFDIVYY